MRYLINRSVLVTGATKGIGLACTKRLIDESASVVALGRDFTGFEPECERLICDLSNTRLLEQSLTRFPADSSTLILNAGMGLFGGLEQFSHAQIQSVLSTNLISNLIIIKHYLPRMKRAGGGDIVLIGSESAIQGARAGAVYCASKFAIRGVAQSLRADCSTSNIRVHLINPGPVDSNFFNDLNFKPKEGHDFVLNPQDVANAIISALDQPRHVVTDEINLQPIKRSFVKK